MGTVCFLTSLIPQNMYDMVNSKSTQYMSDAANALQWHIHEGLCMHHQCAIELVNVLPIGSYPQYYKDMFVRKEYFSVQGEKSINVGFCNIKLLGRMMLYKHIVKALLEAIGETKNGVLYVYSIPAPFLKAVKLLKKTKPGVKVCAIVADLPEMTTLSNNASLLQRMYDRFLARKAYRNLEAVDAFVLLTKQMADYLKITKPYVVVEGISTEEADFSVEDETFGQNSDLKIVMYTGTLNERFGILNLIDAFTKIEKEEYRLVLCGIGDSQRIIKEAEKRDSRIIYMGQQPRKKVLSLQKKATVLVNPRQNKEEFTKYSFPSKNLEYLSSGTPVIAYKLDGIPDEYDKYLFYVYDNSVDSLRNRIIEICEMDKEKLRKRGQEGKAFVCREKNSQTQTRKIYDMMENLS